MHRKIVKLLILTFFICLVIIIGGKGFSYIARKISGNPPSKKIVNGGANPTGPGELPIGTGEGLKGSESENSNEYALENATYVNAEGKHIIKDPDNLLVLVNKSRNLTEDYEPGDLVIPDVKFANENSTVKKMRKPAAEALERLFDGAKQDNINLAAVSGYRSYDKQKRIYESNVKQMGEKAASRVSAYPGQSEHQTGLAMDVSSASAGYTLEESFGDTKEGKWLRENAAKYGFIIRYTKDKEDITGYSYEPWHVRYVGEEIASSVMEKGITLEEYFNALD